MILIGWVNWCRVVRAWTFPGTGIVLRQWGNTLFWFYQCLPMRHWVCGYYDKCVCVWEREREREREREGVCVCVCACACVCVCACVRARMYVGLSPVGYLTSENKHCTIFFAWAQRSSSYGRAFYQKCETGFRKLFFFWGGGGFRNAVTFAVCFDFTDLGVVYNYRTFLKIRTTFGSGWVG